MERKNKHNEERERTIITMATGLTTRRYPIEPVKATIESTSKISQMANGHSKRTIRDIKMKQKTLCRGQKRKLI